MTWPVILVLVCGLGATLVYVDATNKNIGQVEKRDLRAGDWAIGCLVCGPLGVAWYLSKRRRLVEKAKAHPVTVEHSQKIGRIVLLWLFVFGTISHIHGPF